jgi:TatD DNase family protein
VIDFHCHLDLYLDPHKVAGRCVERDMDVLSVTTTPSAWSGTSALARGSDRIRTSLGLHPQLARERKAELALFEQLLPETRYVGEIGLDGSEELKPHWSDQMEVFASILDACTATGGRILSIHSRRAATAVLEILESRRSAGTPILHWFTGGKSELARAVDLGCWFTVGPAMLASGKGRTLVAGMPRERLLTESDGPFARVEGRGALPWDVGRAVIGLAALWDEPVQIVQEQLLANLRRLESAEVE